MESRREAGFTKRERSRARLLSAYIDLVRDDAIEPSMAALAVQAGVGRSTAYTVCRHPAEIRHYAMIFGLSDRPLDETVKPHLENTSAQYLYDMTIPICKFVSGRYLYRYLSYPKYVREYYSSYEPLPQLELDVAIDKFHVQGLYLYEALARVVQAEWYAAVGYRIEACRQAVDARTLLQRCAAETSVGTIALIRLTRVLAIVENSLPKDGVRMEDLAREPEWKHPWVLEYFVWLSESGKWARSAMRYDLSYIVMAEWFSSKYYFPVPARDWESLLQDLKWSMDLSFPLSGLSGVPLDPHRNMSRELIDSLRDIVQGRRNFQRVGGAL